MGEAETGVFLPVYIHVYTLVHRMIMKGEVLSSTRGKRRDVKSRDVMMMTHRFQKMKQK